jgi:hypothetical protein
MLRIEDCNRGGGVWQRSQQFERVTAFLNVEAEHG